MDESRLFFMLRSGASGAVAGGGGRNGSGGYLGHDWPQRPPMVGVQGGWPGSTLEPCECQ
jgi:hypothetical protein